jgi:hypothetical protein
MFREFRSNFSQRPRNSSSTDENPKCHHDKDVLTEQCTLFKNKGARTWPEVLAKWLAPLKAQLLF